MPHQPTRLPYGLSFVKPGANSVEYTFTAGDVTPDVSMGTFFVTAASSLTITNFDGGERGKVIYLFCNSGGATTIQNSAGGININNIVGATSNNQVITVSATAGNAVLLNNEVAQFMHNGTDWSLVGNRFVISTQV